MFSFGFGEILIIGIVMLLFVGPDRLPQLMRTAGRAYGQLRRSADELRRAFMVEADRADTELRVEELEQRRREIAEHRRKALEAAGEGAAAQSNEIAMPERNHQPDNDGVPGGFSSKEWEELPAHLQQAVRSAAGQGESRD